MELAHHEEGQLASHLLASVPYGTYMVAFHPDRDPIFWQRIANHPEFVDGELELTDEPGSGWVLDREFIEKHWAD